MYPVVLQHRVGWQHEAKIMVGKGTGACQCYQKSKLVIVACSADVAHGQQLEQQWL